MTQRGHTNRVAFHDLPDEAWNQIDWSDRMPVAARKVERSRNIGPVRNIESVAASVHPMDVASANQQAHAAGIGDCVKFMPNGRAVFATRQAKDKALRAMGMFDKDDGHSPRNAK